jgi:hypothetical protein
VLPARPPDRDDDHQHHALAVAIRQRSPGWLRLMSVARHSDEEGAMSKRRMSRRKSSFVIIPGAGPSCPSCARPMQVREHPRIKAGGPAVRLPITDRGGVVTYCELALSRPTRWSMMALSSFGG